ncbi:TIGR00156 family protein [Gammaproteobacteria bacterium ESL0073]|uniref:NirD/YgiW/YdeI family stress tolerance protein n=1 Tax=Entomomonas moraniae TaxID=2213226 RepID=A0A3Q9JKU4_9GAMM|nr:NirD/YgiW/YdeI family stress tolerance protein [Entomomonas moraniae]AWM81332.1 TIGR00156 family protein [Gammaproteobacteria bacterium ESL0073]AZS51836.1 NirD/YgiW/YdeI family stress tolerance protein [Entomomonas moraniae]
MKKIIAATLLIASTSFALADGYTGPANQATTGYTGPTNSAAQLTTVKQAKTMRDDSYVTLRGKIVNHIKKDRFTFQDSTDSIVVEIDDDLWYGTTIGPNDTVEIIGEVDKDSPWGKVEIEVKNMKKI